MTTLFILIPIAFIFVAVAVKLFFWAVKSGQYDDLNTESKRILFDDVDENVQKQLEHKDDQASTTGKDS